MAFTKASRFVCRFGFELKLLTKSTAMAHNRFRNYTLCLDCARCPLKVTPKDIPYASFISRPTRFSKICALNPRSCESQFNAGLESRFGFNLHAGETLLLPPGAENHIQKVVKLQIPVLVRATGGPER